MLRVHGRHKGLLLIGAASLSVAARAAEPAPQDLAELRALVAEGDYEQSQTIARRKIEALDRRGSADTLEAAELLDILVEARWRNGEAADGDTRDLGERSLALKRRLLGPEDAGIGMTLHHLGVVDFQRGDYAKAREEWTQALTIREHALGPDHADVGETANAMANLLQTTGEFEAARPLYERAVAIRERALGFQHPKVAQTLNNLASLLTVLGDYPAALTVAERSLAIKEATFGPENPQVAASLTNLADIYDQTGDRERARQMFERAAAIWEKALGADNPLVGVALNNLAEQFRRSGQIEEARPLFQRVIAIWEKAYGADHERLALALSNYGLLLEAAGELPAAQTYLERATAIREKALGAEHPDFAESLGNIGDVLSARGEFEQALPLFDRASAIGRQTLGAGHPFLARAELGRARALAFRDLSDRAFDGALEAERIGRDHLRLTGRSLAEEHALRYAAERPLGLDLALSLAVERPERVPTRTLFDALVRSRAVVLDEMAARHRSVSGAASPEVARLAESLAGLRSRLANMTVRGIGELEPEAYRALLDRTREEKERAERALGAASAGFALEQQRSRVGLDEVATALPPRSAIVAFAVYGHQSLPRPPAAGAAPVAPVAPTKPVSSIAAVILATGKAAPAVVRLGTVEEIDAFVRRWKREASEGESSIRRTPEEAEAAYREVGGELRRAIWDPIAARLSDIDRVFLVPDGSLNLVSFASLPTGENGYLVESGPTLHYLSAERDLVPAAAPPRPGTGLFAIGGPDYDGGAPSTDVEVSRAVSGTRSAGCASFSSLSFDPLPAAEREASEIVALWNEASAAKADGVVAPVYLHGAAATEGAFKRSVSGHRVLHLATHGFFLGGDCAVGAAGSRGLKIVAEKAAEPVITGYVSPLLLSGLALAGANRRATASAADEDGVLTAEEIAGLDLSGVEWAVMSACDTGVGEIRAGEGVFGLRRAMQLAGVQTLVMSLWPVDDEATRDWMKRLYRARLMQGLDTAAAVREAGGSVVRARREAGQSTHPFYWAAFVAAGDWR